jgi:hypothetical protein
MVLKMVWLFEKVRQGMVEDSKCPFLMRLSACFLATEGSFSRADEIPLEEAGVSALAGQASSAGCPPGCNDASPLLRPEAAITLLAKVYGSNKPHL